MAATTQTVNDMEKELAREAIALQRQFNELQEKLDAKKDQFRDLANGNTLEIVVEGEGKINVSSPREGSSKVVLTVNEEILNANLDLKNKLLKKKVLTEEVKTQNPAKASVTIKPNV